MNPEDWQKWIGDQFPDIVVKNAYRELSFFYNPGRLLPNGVYFSTIKESDGPNDAFSYLDREGIFRISMGIGKKKYEEIFGRVPKRAVKGQSTLAGIWDFEQPDVLTPHPVYAWMGWVCILNPTTLNQAMVKTLITDSYDMAVRKYEGRMRRSGT